MQIKILILLLFIAKIILPTENNMTTQKISTSVKIQENNTTELSINKDEIEIENVIGSIIIPSINLNNNLYDITSKYNNIEENVTILKSSNDISKKESLIILAAHSGQGKIAYFNNLNKLKLNDTIILEYYNQKYIFQVSNISEQEKIGYINIQKKNISQLILTTCSTTNKNKQLIIECTIKES